MVVRERASAKTKALTELRKTLELELRETVSTTRHHRSLINLVLVGFKPITISQSKALLFLSSLLLHMCTNQRLSSCILYFLLERVMESRNLIHHRQSYRMNLRVIQEMSESIHYWDWKESTLVLKVHLVKSHVD